MSGKLALISIGVIILGVIIPPLMVICMPVGAILLVLTLIAGFTGN